MTLVSASPAREHLLKLRAAGGTYEAIGRATGIGAMTVHGIANGRRLKVQADVARRLLTVTEDDIAGCILLRTGPCGDCGHWSR